MSVLVSMLLASVMQAAEKPAWKAGVATVNVTPRESMWMAGYAARTKPSEGVAQDLYAKALALEDAEQNRLVIVTMDLIGVPRPLRDAVERKVQSAVRVCRGTPC